jgi:CheY-like chemotaxis protein
MADVLIIEPDAGLVAQLQAACRTAGIHADTAQDGAEALSSLDWHPPKVILCAAQLADMHGWELCQVVRDDPKTVTLPFVLMFDQPDAGRAELSDCGATLVSPRENIVEHAPRLLRSLLGERRATTRGEAPSPSPDEVMATRSTAPTLHGTFSILGLADLVQTIAGGKRDGRLLVSVRGNAGTMHFRAGQLVEAEFGTCRGEAAVGELMEQTDARQGSFVFVPGDANGPGGSIRKSVQQLLLDVATNLDQRRAHLIGDGLQPSTGS